MTIIYRIDKNAPLSTDELDGNFQWLQSQIDTLNASPASDGAAGSNWFVSSSAPVDANPPAGFRDDIDIYLDETTGEIYKRSAGVFASVGNIQGPVGASGADGASGIDGVDGATWFTSAGPLDPASPPAGMVDGDYHLDTISGDVTQLSGGVAVSKGNIRGPEGPQGPAGEAAANGANGSIWFAEAAAPVDATPPEGFRDDLDFYLDTQTGNVYQRSAGAFYLTTTLVGPQGLAGADGADAATWFTSAGPLDPANPPAGMVDGDFHLDTVSGDVTELSAGTAVAKGNIRGPQGLPGEAGVKGEPGSRWFSGVGSTLPAEMVDGDHFLDTATGDVYEKVAGAATLRANIQGPAGPAGADAPAGTSEIANENRTLISPESSTALFDHTSGALGAGLRVLNGSNSYSVASAFAALDSVLDTARDSASLIGNESETALFDHTNGSLGPSLKILNGSNSYYVSTSIAALDAALNGVKNSASIVANETDTALFDHTNGTHGTKLKVLNGSNSYSVTSSIAALDSAIDQIQVGAAAPNPDHIEMQSSVPDAADPDGTIRYSDANGLTIKRGSGSGDQFTGAGEYLVLDAGSINEGSAIHLIGGTPGNPLKIGTHSFFLEYATSGNWLPPHDRYHANSMVYVRAWGGGGGGERNSAGGGGGYAEGCFRLQDLGSSIPITVGAGGTGSETNLGNDGGKSTFGSLLTAYGGTRATSDNFGGGGAGAFGSPLLNSGKGGRGGGGVPGISGSDSSASGGDASNPWGGGAGGGFGNQGYNAEGGFAMFGGGGGAVGTAPGGKSIHGGAGGADGQPGVLPAGGGGARANGANGLVRIWIVT